jgi:hypothetical protein
MALHAILWAMDARTSNSLKDGVFLEEAWMVVEIQ